MSLLSLFYPLTDVLFNIQLSGCTGGEPACKMMSWRRVAVAMLGRTMNRNNCFRSALGSKNHLSPGNRKFKLVIVTGSIVHLGPFVRVVYRPLY